MLSESGTAVRSLDGGIPASSLGGASGTGVFRIAAPASGGLAGTRGFGSWALSATDASTIKLRQRGFSMSKYSSWKWYTVNGWLEHLLGRGAPFGESPKTG